MGVSVAKTSALVHTDIWSQRKEAGDIYEFDELLEPTEVPTLSSLEKLEGEIANTGHLLVRHKSGLRCQSCNVYRARRQFKFWSKTPYVPRPSSGDVIASFSVMKRKYNMAISSQLTDDAAVF